jgi:hypothetical protein
MKALILISIPILAILLVLALVWAVALRAKVARLTRRLAGMEDPKNWLSDDDRRKYALELLDRERASYQDGLTNQYLDQVKQFNTPTMKEGNK